MLSILNVAPAQELPQLLFDNYSTADGLSSNEAHATLQDKKGFLWAATANGLNRFDGYSFKTYLHDPGDSASIGDNTVYALAEDSKGFLWVGTGNGLYRYDPLTDRFSGSYLPTTIDSSGFDVKQIFMDSHFDDPIAGKTYFGSIYHNRSLLILDKKTGLWETIPLPLLDKMFAGPVKLLKDRKGFLWFLTNKGLFRFDLATRRFEEKQVVAGKGENLGQLFCRRREQDAEGNLWFRFDNGSLVKYALADDTFTLIHERVSTLGKGQNGKLLIVKHDGILLLHQQDIHDEAGAGLTKIGLTAQVAAHLPPSENTELKRRLEAILAETRSVSARLGEVLFAVNPRYDRFEAVQAWLREWCGRFLEDMGMAAEFDLPKSSFDSVLSPEVKRNLLLILKEALNNAVKYAGSERVHITSSLAENGRGYLLRVQDFGRGFEPEGVGALSNGIAGMRNRAGELKAIFLIKSVAGQGTTLTLEGGIGA